MTARCAGVTSLLAIVGLFIVAAIAPLHDRQEPLTMQREPSRDVSLSVQAQWSDRDVRISYEFRNAGREDVYLLDALPVRDPASGQPVADPAAYSLHLRDPDEAVVLVGIPPLPSAKTVAVRMLPVASKVSAGATVRRKLHPIPVPLTERSIYATEEESRQATPVNVRRLVLAVQYIEASTPGLVVSAVPYAPDRFSVKTPRTADDARTVEEIVTDRSMILNVLPWPR